MKKSICILIILFITGNFFSLTLYAQQPNTLTAKETQQGWKLLFNGKDLNGWHSYLEKDRVKHGRFRMELFSK